MNIICVLFCKAVFAASVLAAWGGIAIAQEKIGTTEADAPKTGTLKIQFKYRGDVPKIQPVANAVGAFCGKAGVMNETLIVNEANKGIQDVLVHVYTGRRGTKLPPQKPLDRILQLANKNCRFEPHVLITQVGDTLLVTNPDPVGHNVNIAFFNNRQSGVMVPVGGNLKIPLLKSEPAVVPAVCNIHPWMKAHLLVLDHPFAAASNKDGLLEIKDLPLGKIVFRAWHEQGTFKKEIYINGKQEKWKSNRFEIDIKEGVNDLGVIEIPKSEFE